MNLAKKDWEIIDFFGTGSESLDNLQTDVFEHADCSHTLASSENARKITRGGFSRR